MVTYICHPESQKKTTNGHNKGFANKFLYNGHSIQLDPYYLPSYKKEKGEKEGPLVFLFCWLGAHKELALHTCIKAVFKYFSLTIKNYW